MKIDGVEIISEGEAAARIRAGDYDLYRSLFNRTYQSCICDGMLSIISMDDAYKAHKSPYWEVIPAFPWPEQ